MTTTMLRILLAAAMVAGAGDCWAQQRSGLMGGLSVGGGSLSLEGSAGEDAGLALVRQRDSHLGTLSLDLRLGGMLSEKTAIMLVVALDSGAGTTYREGVELGVGDVVVAFPSSETSLWSGVMGGAVQRWLTSRVWVRGGIGAGYLQRDFTLGSDADYLTLTLDRGYAVAVLAGAGADIYRRSNFAIGAEFRFSAFSLSGVGVYAPNLQVGFNWY